MGEMTSWLLRPRIVIGLLIFAVIVLFLVGYNAKQVKQREMATSASNHAGKTIAPERKTIRNALSTLPVISVSIAGHPFKLWLANTTAEETAGLMHVHDLAADRGMVFLFRKAKPEAFWMKNTPLPLDLIFLNRSTVVRIYTMKPMNSKLLYPSKQAVTAAIELNAGTCAKLGLKSGDRIKLPVSAE